MIGRSDYVNCDVIGWQGSGTGGWDSENEAPTGAVAAPCQDRK